MKPNRNQGRTQDFYSYSLNFLGLAAGNSSTLNFSIDTDSDFYLMKLTQQSDIGAAALTSATDVVPLCTIQITDGGSSRRMFSDAVPLSAVFGNGKEPYILPSPRMFAAGSTIQVTLTNYDAAATYNSRLVFAGIKEYQY